MRVCGTRVQTMADLDEDAAIVLIDGTGHTI